MELNREEIYKIIPQRAPFLFVDRILDCIPGQYAEGSKTVYPQEFYFQGHFPSSPVMPGVLLLECIGQVGAIALLTQRENAGKLVLLAGVEKARFRKPVFPGDELLIKTRLGRWRGKAGLCRGVIQVKGEIVAEAELFAFIKEKI